MNNFLKVYWENELVGQITVENSLWQFQYSVDWLNNKKHFPLSISLPLQESKFEHKFAYAFFANLLPEAGIKEKIARILGYSIQNDFALLDAVGGECAGAITIVSDEHKISEGQYIELDVKQLEEMIHHQSERPLLMGKDGLRLSLAGAQNKLPVYYDGKKFYLPTGNKPSTHILKPAIPGFECSIENEEFCMKLAGSLGINTADIEIMQLEKIKILVITRYDRIKQNDKIIRLHQEDFCQALGYPYNQKYEAEGGPSLKECFFVLQNNSSRPLVDKNKLLKTIIFNFLIGNADAHAKNISFLYKNDSISLTPSYDLMSTLVYPELTDKMAMKIGGENRFNWVQYRHWEKLAEDIDIKKEQMFDMLETISLDIVKESEKLIKDKKENRDFFMKIHKGILSRVFKR